MPRSCHTKVTVTMVVVTLLASVLLPSSAARAHDSGDLPSSGSEDARPRAPGANLATSSPARRSLRWPLALIGAGVLAGAGGAWVVHEEARPVAGPCMSTGFGRSSCPSPSTGGGAGMALVLVGGQLALGGVIWLAISMSAHHRYAPLALGVGPGTLGLRATF